jgi:hypothetical protein
MSSNQPETTFHCNFEFDRGQPVLRFSLKRSSPEPQPDLTPTPTDAPPAAPEPESPTSSPTAAEGSHPSDPDVAAWEPILSEEETASPPTPEPEVPDWLTRLQGIEDQPSEPEPPPEPEPTPGPEASSFWTDEVRAEIESQGKLELDRNGLREALSGWFEEHDVRPVVIDIDHSKRDIAIGTKDVGEIWFKEPDRKTHLLASSSQAKALKEAGWDSLLGHISQKAGHQVESLDFSSRKGSDQDWLTELEGGEEESLLIINFKKPPKTMKPPSTKATGIPRPKPAPTPSDLEEKPDFIDAMMKSPPQGKKKSHEEEEVAVESPTKLEPLPATEPASEEPRLTLPFELGPESKLSAKAAPPDKEPAPEPSTSEAAAKEDGFDWEEVRERIHDNKLTLKQDEVFAALKPLLEQHGISPDYIASKHGLVGPFIMIISKNPFDFLSISVIEGKLHIRGYGSKEKQFAEQDGSQLTTDYITQNLGYQKVSSCELHRDSTGQARLTFQLEGKETQQPPSEPAPEPILHPETETPTAQAVLERVASLEEGQEVALAPAELLAVMTEHPASLNKRYSFIPSRFISFTEGSSGPYYDVQGQILEEGQAEVPVNFTWSTSIHGDLRAQVSFEHFSDPDDPITRAHVEELTSFFSDRDRILDYIHNLPTPKT